MAGRTVQSTILRGKASTASAELWSAVEGIVANAPVDGIRAHKLGPLAARFRREAGEPVPSVLAADERGAAVAIITSTKLLERVRAVCDGPLVVVKGPEVARLYPGSARAFSDVDLLVPDAPAVQRALLADGFVEVGGLVPAAHLMPLKSPELGLRVEVHKHPSWPKRLSPPPFDALLDDAVQSACGVDGILAPAPRHHALIISAHAWKENPLGTMRDLVDVAAVSAGTARAEIDAAAAAWGIDRVWRATWEALDALLEGKPLPLPLRLWARHLESLRERTVLENHLRGWLHGFSKLPPRAALGDTRDALRKDILPRPGETWRDKFSHVGHALRHPGRPSRPQPDE